MNILPKLGKKKIDDNINHIKIAQLIQNFYFIKLDTDKRQVGKKVSLEEYTQEQKQQPQSGKVIDVDAPDFITLAFGPEIVLNK